MEVNLEISDRFYNFMFDWDYKRYLLVGGYGSGKSYNVGEKIILKLMEEKRKALVVRNVFETIGDSCYDLLKEILSNMDMLAADEYDREERRTKAVAKKSPMSIVFPNGSKIIFKGMDKPEKIKSINGVSIVWLEECSEIKYAAYKELLGRIRTPDVSLHFILSCNPVGKENWVYRHFFARLNDDGSEEVIVDAEEFYSKKTLVHNGTYYMHSTPDDNPWLPASYIKDLDEMEEYDKDLYRIARLGRFGINGTKVLPQFERARDPVKFVNAVRAIPISSHYYGFDFGFETSYNAVVSMAVDYKNSILYIYDEIYKNHINDADFALDKKMLKLKEKLNTQRALGDNPNMIIADNEDPKAISYYRDCGYFIRACRNKFAGSRLSNTRKMKRFKKIICSPKCTNTIRELKDLTYKKKDNGDIIYDEFNIDPHTFSAMWYGLEKCNVSNLKERKFNSKSGRVHENDGVAI